MTDVRSVSPWAPAATVQCPRVLAWLEVKCEGVHQSETRLGLCINVRAICRRPARWRRSFNPERSARRLGAYVRTSSCMSTPSRPKLHQLSNSAHVLVLVGSLGAHGQICSGGLRGRLCGWVQTGCGANPQPRRGCRYSRARWCSTRRLRTWEGGWCVRWRDRA